MFGSEGSVTAREGRTNQQGRKMATIIGQHRCLEGSYGFLEERRRLEGIEMQP